MKRRDLDLEPELEAFLEPRTIDRRVPADLRARALAGARAIVAAGGAIPRTPLAELPPPLPIPVARGRLFRIAVAASLAFVTGTVAAVAALRGRADLAPLAKQTLLAPPVARAGRAAEPAREIGGATAAEPVARLKPARARTNVDTVTAELELVQRAHAAFTRRDFIRALTLAAEHSRRFPNGHLAEQREALRVHSLASAGRADEAHRAASAFAARFPRSVLLPRLEGGSQAPD